MQEGRRGIFSGKDYFTPEITGILADAFGYNRLFLLNGEDGLFKDLRDENKVYEMWKKDKLERLHSYLYRMSRCWDNPKAIEIFDTYDEIQRTDSKMEILIKTQRIETLFKIIPSAILLAYVCPYGYVHSQHQGFHQKHLGLGGRDPAQG